MRFRLILVVTLGALAIAVSGGASAASSAPPSARVRPAAGWVVVKPTKTEQPNLYRSMVVAVTAPDVAAAHPFALPTSLKRLSARGILIWVTTIGFNRPSFGKMRWPPRLTGFRVDHGWESQPAANIQQRLEWGAVRGWDMDVRVYFATQHPDRKLLDEAQAELERLLLPFP